MVSFPSEASSLILVSFSIRLVSYTDVRVHVRGERKGGKEREREGGGEREINTYIILHAYYVDFTYMY